MAAKSSNETQVHYNIGKTEMKLDSSIAAAGAHALGS
jgi:hypothetical protein